MDVSIGEIENTRSSRVGSSRIMGFPSLKAYWAQWKKVLVLDLVANVARVGGSFLLYVLAPNLYHMLPATLVG